MPKLTLTRGLPKQKLLEVDDLKDPGPQDAIRFGERGTAAPEDRDPPTTPAQRQAALARDSFRCRVCGSKHNLTVHHLKSRANGGKTTIEYLCSACSSCHGAVHEGLLKLNVGEAGKVTPLDSDGNPLQEEGGVAGALEKLADKHGGLSEDCQLTVIERDEPAEAPATDQPAKQAMAQPAEQAADRAGGVPAVESIDDLPDELTSAQWQELGGQVQWNQSRRSFLFRPGEFSVPRGLKNDPRGSFLGSEMLPDNDLQRRIVQIASAPRPGNLEDFVGQTDVLNALGLAARAARERGEPLGHLLLNGQGGLGKTTLAHALAAEMGTRAQTVMGPTIEQPQQLIAILTSLGPREILFIDEIHGLTKSCEEFLYSALEDSVLPVTLYQGSRSKPIRILLEPFTLIGATTSLGELSEPFRARFKLKERLKRYTVDELAEVTARAAPHLGTSIDEKAATIIARMARGTPREAITLLETARDVVQVTGSSSIDFTHVEEVLAQRGIDEYGLRPEDRKILTLLLTHGRPMGLDSIAMTLDISPTDLKSVYEPFLVNQGFIARTRLGRQATAKARFCYGDRARQAS